MTGDLRDRHGEVTVIAAPAKVNLNLRITGRRDDGYHLLESVVIFTSFGDRLAVGPATSDSLELAGPFAAAIAETSDNICFQALGAFRRAGGQIGPLQIRLEKHIPVGAGLGGGSSDAAAILRYVNQISESPLSSEDIQSVALELGADVPVCLQASATVMRGIGEQLSLLAHPLRGHMVLARPDVVLSTPDVFRAYANGDVPFSQEGEDSLSALPTELVAGGNDLQQAAISLCPQIGQLIDDLGELTPANHSGARHVQMSGSGSACFALFEDAESCEAAQRQLTEKGYWAVATEF